MNAISWNKSSRWLAVLCSLVVVGCLARAAGFRINPTPSMPKGLYRMVKEAPAKGNMVTFCLQGEFAFLAQERGYVQAGSCPNGLRPLLKRLADLPGDYIEAMPWLFALWIARGGTCLLFYSPASFLPAWLLCWQTIQAALIAAISAAFPWKASRGCKPF